MLIVIDVQRRFPAAQLVIDYVVEEIKKAKRNKELVVLVQYGYKTRSLKPVLDALKGYKYLSIRKTEDDGGIVIFDTINKCSNKATYKLNSLYTNFSGVKSIKICGVNTGACVLKTVRTLSYLRFPIKVLSHACANEFWGASSRQNDAEHYHALKRMASWKNVEVV